MPIIHRVWTKSKGFKYYFVLKGKTSPRYPTFEDAEAGLRATQKNAKSGQL